MAVMVVEKSTFSASMASTGSQLAQLFQVVRSLMHFGTPEDWGEYSVEHCGQFGVCFADKINPIGTDSDSDSGFGLQNLNTPRALSGPIFRSKFVLVLSEDVARIVGG